MDVTLGPWKAEKGVDKAQQAPLTEAMGDEAWKTVKKTDGFTPQKAPQGEVVKSGYSISGRLASVVTKGRTVQVTAKYDIWVDGAISNVATVEGKASAEGSYGAEDALRAVTESRVKMLLSAIQAGRVARLG